jgi:mannose/cellobiose epimerase-like protein (N-acyl-D-glucosamine 2-epimerase family)
MHGTRAPTPSSDTPAPQGAQAAPPHVAGPGKYGALFLHAHIRSILGFYDPVVRDDKLGGFHNQLRDDGSVYDALTKHAVGTARFTVNYALAFQLYALPAHRSLCEHGMEFLMRRQLDEDGGGGFAWVLQGLEVSDGQKWCYSVAFSLLALANAHKAGIAGAEAHLRSVLELAEQRYYEPQHGLYIDSYNRDFSDASNYRGQNANMHMCEAMIACFEATGEVALLRRASAIARKLCLELAPARGGHVYEHYTEDWRPDPGKNRDADPQSEEYIFRPFGFQPGHSFEWSKLILLLERHTSALSAAASADGGDDGCGGGAEALECEWMLPTARRLFDTAVRCGWDHEGGGGAFYTYSMDNESGASKALDTNKCTPELLY